MVPSIYPLLVTVLIFFFFPTKRGSHSLSIFAVVMGDSDESDNDALAIKTNPSFDLLKRCTSAWQQLSAKRKITHELKQYQELFLTELPGSTKVTSQATHAVLEGELSDDESSKRVAPRFRDRDQGPSAGDKKKVM